MNETLESVRALARGELSLLARLGYVTLLLVAAGMSAVILALWVTEPGLPVRAQLVFAVLSLIGISWVALASWVLVARRPLFARDRVIAGRMAVGFTGLFTLGAATAVALGGAGAAIGALATGLVMMIVAIAVLRSARRRHASLTARRMELEASLAR